MGLAGRATPDMRRLNLKSPAPEPIATLTTPKPEPPAVNPGHLPVLTSSGVIESEARKHLAALPPEFPVMDTFEWSK